MLPILLGACSKALQCPPFDETERNQWLPQAAGSTIVFEQEADHSLIRFTVTTNDASQAYTEQPFNSGLGYAVKDCEAEASLRMTSVDTQLVKVAEYRLSLTSFFVEDSEQGRGLKYSIGDFESGFNTFPSLSMPVTEAITQRDRDSIIDNMALGGKIYERVLIQTRSNADTAGKTISKVYLAPGYGIVGFVSKGQRYLRRG